MTENIKPKFTIAIHGGATNDLAKNKNPKRPEHMQFILKQGASMLESGKSALDVAVWLVSEMEGNTDSMYNAGRGSYYAEEKGEKIIQMDAAVMSGVDGLGASVMCVENVAHPVIAAKQIMDKHGGYKAIAGDEGVKRFLEWLPHENPYGLDIIENREVHFTRLADTSQTFDLPSKDGNSKGTVGAVVLDTYGNLAAATSTGGSPGKQYGRVGDSPIIGAGTYADKNVAVSCTGYGEYFIQGVAGHDVAARIEYGGQNLDQATSGALEKVQKHSLQNDVERVGGMIAVDREGNVSMPFVSEGMYRASINQEGDVYYAEGPDDPAPA